MRWCSGSLSSRWPCDCAANRKPREARPGPPRPEAARSEPVLDRGFRQRLELQLAAHARVQQVFGQQLGGDLQAPQIELSDVLLDLVAEATQGAVDVAVLQDH